MFDEIFSNGDLEYEDIKSIFLPHDDYFKVTYKDGTSEEFTYEAGRLFPRDDE